MGFAVGWLVGRIKFTIDRLVMGLMPRLPEHFAFGMLGWNGRVRALPYIP
jgi:hypothetical protein